MSRCTPIRLAMFAALLLALTFATIRAERRHAEPSQGLPETSMMLGEITVPVEIIETGEAPALLNVQVRP